MTMTPWPIGANKNDKAGLGVKWRWFIKIIYFRQPFSIFSMKCKGIQFQKLQLPTYRFYQWMIRIHFFHRNLQWWRCRRWECWGESRREEGTESEDSRWEFFLLICSERFWGRGDRELEGVFAYDLDFCITREDWPRPFGSNPFSWFLGPRTVVCCGSLVRLLLYFHFLILLIIRWNICIPSWYCEDS